MTMATMISPPASPRGRPGALVLARAVDGRLWAARDADMTAVVVRRCFPWSDPGRFISLRNEENTEVALIADPRELDPESRRALEDALAQAGFVLEVEAVRSVDEEVEIRCWKVRTRQGERTFQTRLDDWPRRLPGGGFLLRDVAGDLYRIPDPATLDETSRSLLWAFVD